MATAVKVKTKVPTAVVILFVLGTAALAAAALGINIRGLQTGTRKLAAGQKTTSQATPSPSTGAGAGAPAATPGTGAGVGAGVGVGEFQTLNSIRVTGLEYKPSRSEVVVAIQNDGPNRANNINVSLYRTFRTDRAAELIDTRTLYTGTGIVSGRSEARFSDVTQRIGERFCALVNLTPGTGFVENNYCDNVILGAETID